MTITTTNTLAINLHRMALCAFITAFQSRLNVFARFRMERQLRPMLDKYWSEVNRANAGLDSSLGEMSRKLERFVKVELETIARSIRDREGNYRLLAG